MRTNNYVFIAQEILGKDLFDELYSFFINIISDDKYTYKIFMSRRCSNLYKIFSEIYLHDDTISTRAEKKSQVYSTRVFFDNALYSTYDEKNKISFLSLMESVSKDDAKIAIIDDILIHGRTVQSLIKHLVDKLNVQISNIDVLPFIVNLSAISMDIEYYSRVSCWRRWEPKSWRGITVQLSDLISCTLTPNTSFVMSAKFDDSPGITSKPYGWNKYNAPKNIPTYPNIDTNKYSYEIYYKPCIVNNQVKAWSTIRVYQHEGTVLFIPFVFVNRIGETGYESIKECLLKLLSKTTDGSTTEYGDCRNINFGNNVWSDLADILNKSCTRSQLQVITMLLCQHVLTDFLCECKIDFSLENFDFDKVCRSFGITGLDSIITPKPLFDETNWITILNYFTEYNCSITPLCTTQDSLRIDKNKRDQVSIKLHNLGKIDEINANQNLMGCNMMRFRQYRGLSSLLQSCNKIDEYISIFIGVLQCIDSGEAGLVTSENYQNDIYSLKAGERALYKEYFELNRYFLAVREIYDSCQIFRLDFDKELYEYLEFISDQTIFLNRYDIQPIYRKIKRFITMLNNTNQNIDDWDFPIYNNTDIENRRMYYSFLCQYKCGKKRK